MSDDPESISDATAEATEAGDAAPLAAPAEDAPGGQSQPARTKLSSIGAWGRLLRLPNLLSVPGDPLGGFVLACVVLGINNFAPLTMLYAAGASFLLYCAGLLTNDYFDLDEDRRDRPDRPLPSRAVSPVAVIIVAAVLGAGGIIVAGMAGRLAAVTAGALAVAVLVYDMGGKRVPLLGPLNMGLCRGLSLLLGAAAAGGLDALTALPVQIAAAGLTLYIAAVTVIAARETQAAAVGLKRWLPLVAQMAWFYAMFANLDLHFPGGRAFGVLMIVAGLWLVWCTWRLRGTPPPATVQKTIGSYLQALLVMQAAMVALAGPTLAHVGVGLLLAVPLSALLSHWFYAS